MSGYKYATYKGYMASKKWKESKARYWASRCPKTCYGCGISGTIHAPLDLHHRTYRRMWGKEHLTDLVPVCRPCHDRVHAFIKKALGRGAQLEGVLNRAAYYIRQQNKRTSDWTDCYDLKSARSGGNPFRNERDRGGRSYIKGPTRVRKLG